MLDAFSRARRGGAPALPATEASPSPAWAPRPTSRPRVVAALLLGIVGNPALIGGCVERRELTAEERQEIARFVSETPPSPAQELRANLEGRVELLGYDVSQTPLVKGTPATVTFYWKVNQTLDKGWKLFTHIDDGRSGDVRMNLDGEGPVRRLHPPSRWKAGQYIRDEQPVTIPEDWPTNEAVFYVGLWNGPHRLEVESGPSDGDDRVRVVKVPVIEPSTGTDVPRLPVPELAVPKAKGSIAIDGDLTDDAWKTAAETRAFVNTLDGSAASFTAKAKLTWDDEHLYVAFQVEDTSVTGAIPGEADTPEAEVARDRHLWEGDVVEIMLDPGLDSRDYYEVQVSPTGHVFDTRYDRRRVPRPFGNLDWSSKIRTQTRIDGTPDDDQPDEGYQVELALPFAALTPGSSPGEAPEVGERWRINFYVMNRFGDGQTAAGWSPTRVSDFHMPLRFGVVTFADAEGDVPNAADLAARRVIDHEAARGLEVLRNPPGAAQEKTPAERLREREQDSQMRSVREPPVPSE